MQHWPHAGSEQGLRGQGWDTMLSEPVQTHACTRTQYVMHAWLSSDRTQCPSHTSMHEWTRCGNKHAQACIRVQPTAMHSQRISYLYNVDGVMSSLAALMPEREQEKNYAVKECWTGGEESLRCGLFPGPYASEKPFLNPLQTPRWSGRRMTTGCRRRRTTRASW